jgi:hypothetical protein
MLIRGIRHAGGRTDVVTSSEIGEDWLRPAGRGPTVSAFPFDWGCQSPGAHRLALALLVSCGIPVNLAQLFADDFLSAVVSHFHRDHFAMSTREITRWVLDVVIAEIVVRRKRDAGEDEG